MLDSLPGLRRELQKIQRSQKLSQQSRLQRYQKKMLQLLIREKTSILENEQLSKQLQNVKKNNAQVQRTIKRLMKSHSQRQQQIQSLKSELQRLSQAYENLQTENKMNQIGRMNQEEKYQQLMEQFKEVEKGKAKVQEELRNVVRENGGLKKSMAEESSRSQQQLQSLRQRIQQLTKQAESNNRLHEKQLTEINTQLLTKTNTISILQQKLQKLQQKLTQSTTSQNTLKQRLQQLISSTTHSQSQITQLSKQLHLLKLKNKQFQQTLYSTEIQKGQQSLQFNKLIKDNKKLKKDLSQLEERNKQLEDEKQSIEEKYQQMTKNYKNAKKQLEKFKDSLSEATQFQSGFKSRIQKLQLSLKQHRQSLQEKQEKCQQLQQQINTLSKQVQSYKSESMQAKYSLEEMRKKYDTVTEARNLAQEKLVLQREENAKSLSSMIKEKDLCYRQNYKLLQIVQVKDKTLQKILNGLRNSQQLQRELSLEISGRENNTRRIIEEILRKDIKGHRDRVKLVDEQLQSYKL